jgi:hypothetical protein
MCRVLHYLFFLKRQSKNLLPAATAQEVVNEMAFLQNLGKEHMADHIEFILEQHAVEANNIEEMAVKVLQHSAHSHADRILCTDHLKEKYCQQQLRYISPESAYLDLDEITKTAYAYYVPVKDTQV